MVLEVEQHVGNSWARCLALGPTEGLARGVEVVDTGSDGKIEFATEGTDRWNITNAGHILPQSNASYDIGSADLKVRHLFLSDNSLWIGDQHKIAISNGKMKFRKRKT